ncbi:hypothetical protein ACU8KH_01067 [Lachancea thermotolerans]|uniref:KLTH0C01540p n=1 Tax=Lachancea thermotolerans (strain ATCC 56472 / CBS 6340 / NRRL Y-8284) TaxID=559295 RepID=C5DDJ7_LACTC|nr:KLTH0C01540p [Lachancea thermotolerans CBS 6340]CAR21858.1 KLTH0C01540p [Lachancea thermotolerans CBS 6340]
MKIDSKIYEEAHRLALMPRMRMMFYGVVCGAIVPAMYLRSYYLPSIKSQDAKDVSALADKVKMLEHRTSNMEHPAVRSNSGVGRSASAKSAENALASSENLGALASVGEVPIASWHIKGRNRFSNDDQYRKLVEEANTIMFSSIM